MSDAATRAWRLRSLAHNAAIFLAAAAVIALVYFIPRDRPGDLEAAPAAAPVEPAAVGLVAPVNAPALEGCFVVERRPDGPGHAPSIPWAGWLHVGDQVQIAGTWHRVVGPGEPGDVLAGETAVLEGERPEGGPWPFRVAREGGR